LLPELHHPNVLRLYEIFMHHSNIHLVLECMSGDLEQLLRGLAAQGRTLSPADVKAYIRMILQGVEHCHQQWIMHRDLKVRHRGTVAGRVGRVCARSRVHFRRCWLAQEAMDAD